MKDTKNAIQILRKNHYEANEVEDKVSVKTTYEAIPELIKLLAKNNVDIYHVVQKEKSLEDIFFDATEGKGGQKDENRKTNSK